MTTYDHAIRGSGGHENEHRLRPYGPTDINRRGSSPTITIIDEVRDAANVEAGTEYHLIGDPDEKRVGFHHEIEGTSIEPLPGDIDLETRTVRAYRGDTGSLYITLPADALAILGLDVGDKTELWASTGGWFEMRPW